MRERDLKALEFDKVLGLLVGLAASQPGRDALGELRPLSEPAEVRRRLRAAGAHMWRQVRRLDIDDPDQCLRLFKSNTVVGWLIFLGLIGGGLWVALKPIV